MRKQQEKKEYQLAKIVYLGKISNFVTKPFKSENHLNIIQDIVWGNF